MKGTIRTTNKLGCFSDVHGHTVLTLVWEGQTVILAKFKLLKYFAKHGSVHVCHNCFNNTGVNILSFKYAGVIEKIRRPLSCQHGQGHFSQTDFSYLSFSPGF